MSRHEEPSWLIDYRKSIINPPKCCHTCDGYNETGICIEFQMIPPADFAETTGACDKWILEIPF